MTPARPSCHLTTSLEVKRGWQVPGGGYKPESSGRQLPLLFFFCAQLYSRGSSFVLRLLCGGGECRQGGRRELRSSQATENVLKTRQVTTRIVGEIDGNCQKWEWTDKGKRGTKGYERIGQLSKCGC
jgi:hypothetical protein